MHDNARRSREFPLLSGQEGIWTAQMLEPDGTAYTWGERIDLGGRVDRHVFVEAAHRVQSEVDVLRMRLVDRDGTPWQRVDSTPEHPPRFVDLSGEPRPDLAAEEWIAQDLARHTALDRQMFTSTLLRLTDHHHVWFNRLHHVVADGLGLSLIRGRVAEVYTDLANGGRPRRSGLGEYSLLCAADLAYRGSEEEERDRAFWCARLADHPEPVSLAGRWAGHRKRLSRATARLSSPLVLRVRDLAQRMRTRSAWVLTAAMATYLSHLTGAQDLLLGHARMCRPTADLRRVPGMVSNVVPVRVRLSPRSTPAELVGQVRDEAADIRGHDRYRLERLQRDLGSVPPDLPLVSLVVNPMPFPTDLRLADVPGTMELLQAGPIHDLSLYLFGEGTDLVPRLDLFANAEVYDQDVLEGHLRRFVRFLFWFVSVAGDPVARLRVVGPAERHALLALAQGPPPRTVPATLGDLFAARAAATPDATALATSNGATSYADLRRDVRRWARVLRERGVGPERVVAVLLPRAPEWVTAVLAVAEAGGAVLPLDPAQPVDRIRVLLDNADPRVLISTMDSPLWSEDLGGVDPILVEGGELRPVATTLASSGLPDSPDSPGSPDSSGPPESSESSTVDNAAYVIYTSGSTGAPKGVVVSHRGLAALAEVQADRFALDQDSRVLFFAALGCDAALAEVISTLLAGGTVVIPSEAEREPGPELARFVAQHHITHATIPPSVLAGMDPDDHPGLRTVVVAGEACPGALVAAWAPGRRIINGYGPTETTVGAAISEPLAGADTPPLGRPIPGIDTHVLDAHLNPCPVGVPGELYVGGPALARGYLHDPALTATRFVANPLGHPGSRLYRTGDRVRWRPDGDLEYLGRVDDQINLHGLRVEPAEVEATLTAHPDVEAAAVVARPDHTGAERLIAYVVGAHGREPDTAELRRHALTRLPRHQLPAVIILLDRLPLTPTGKLDRRALPPPPAPTGGPAPRSPQEQILCGLFAELLDVESVAPDDDFFALGGHSLLATRLVNRVRACFGATLSVDEVFDAPTPARLSQRVDHAMARPARPTPRPAPRPDPIPLSHQQRRLWFLHRMEGPSATYTMAALLRITGDLDHHALRSALADVVERHESLRTVYPELDGTPRQVVLAPSHWRPELRTHHVRAQDLRHHLVATARKTVDLTRDVPVHTELFHVDDQEHVLLLLIHHIAGDGWSMAPLCRDIATAYRARRAGHTPTWPPLPVQYVDYTLWHLRLLGDPDDPDSLYRRQLDYWSTTLAGLPEQIPLPTDRPRPKVFSHQGAVLSFDVDAALHQRLETLARHHDVTLFMVLHAALAALLTRLGAGTDIPLGTAVAGRTDAALDDVVGLFVNTLVLRTNTDGDPTFTELLARVRAIDLAAYAHQDVPFDAVVEAVNPARSAARQPLFQVMLVVQNIPKIRLDLPDARTSMEPLYLDVAKFDLGISFREREGDGATPHGLTAVVEYSSDLFDRETVRNLVDRLLHVLTTVTTRPEQKLSQVDVLLPGERERLLTRWGTSPHHVPPATAPELFARVATDHPEREAVRCGDDSVTYAELDRRSNHLAHRLRRHGVAHERVVALILPRSVDWVVAILATLKAGGAFLPIDPRTPTHRVNTVLTTAQPHIVLTTRGLAQDLTTPAPALLVDQPDPAEPTENTALDDPRVRPSVDQAAYLIFTSGSTGVPKGVVVPHRGLAALAAALADNLRVTPDSRFLQFAAPSFDGIMAELVGALLNAATLVLPPDGPSPLGPALADLAARHRVSHLIVPPSVLATLRPDQLPDVHTLVVVGEPCPPATARDWSTGRRLINGYGPTETTVCAALSEPLSGRRPPPIGHPSHGLRAYVLDERLTPCPTGVAGELYVAGDGLARCYAGRPDLTAAHFVADPFTADGRRMYRTGDLARWRHDGQLEHLGRADQQLKIRGFRVEPGEVEAVLSHHPEVAHAAVIPRVDPTAGSQLVAYVTPTPRPPNPDGAVDHVEHWRHVNDALYAAPDGNPEWGEDFRGWVSSYDGAPIPLPAMREWRDATVTRLRALRPRHVLELGVGSGLLLSALVNECDEYWGSDISPVAVAKLRAHLHHHPETAARTRLRATPAHDLTGLPTAFFDLIVINSTVQYFPDTAYLEHVLRQAVTLLTPDGRIFLGDIRNLRTRHLLYTAMELHRHDDPGAVRRAVERRAAHERELLIDPDYFVRLPDLLEDITEVDIRLRRGRQHTELTRHRYDVLLSRAPTPPVDDDPVSQWTWGSETNDPDRVAALLATQRPRTLRLVQVPNARLAGENAATRALRDGQDLATAVHQLHHPPAPGVDPEHWHDLGDQLGYQVAVTWNGASSEGDVDVVFTTDPTRPTPSGLYRPAPPSVAPVHLANDPDAAQRAHRVASTLRDYLRERLPAPMVPAAVVGLERLPTNPHGKVDRAALPTPDLDGDTGGRPARTSREHTLCRLFADTLGRPTVGVDANFFDLGGHSLLAAQLVTRINQELGVSLPLSALFDTPTVAELSATLDHTDTSPAPSSARAHLLADATLAPEITTNTSRPAETRCLTDPEHILLTSATGFLGAFLLAELLHRTRAHVLCLVRADDPEQARQRLRDTLNRYRIVGDLPTDRITPVVGDLEQPRLGLTPAQFDHLAEQVDVIHHVGARVHVMLPYRQIRAANAHGTHEVLRLAAASRVKPVHHMSTIGVAIAADGSSRHVREDCQLPVELVSANGYVSSKWVAEKLVLAARERGIPTTILRPGRVGGHTHSGVGNTNDALWALIRTMLDVRAAPCFAGDRTGIDVDLVPVDHVARATAELTTRPGAPGNTYHLTAARPVSLDAILDQMRAVGYRLDPVPVEEWLARVDHEATAATDPLRTAGLWHEVVPMLRGASALRFDLSNTRRDLAGADVDIPEISDEILRRYLDYFVDTGFFPPPRGPQERQPHPR